jgi:hypothetical protein
MKLLRMKGSKYKEKIYFKHFIYLPSKFLKILKWKKGEELDVKMENDKIIISKK